MQIPNRDLISQSICLTYGDMVQRYTDGSNIYLLDGHGYVINFLNLTSSFSTSASYAAIATIADVAFVADQALTASLAETASYIAGINVAGTVRSSSYALSASWAPDVTVTVNSASWASASFSSSYSLTSSNAATASYAVSSSHASYALESMSASYAFSSSFAVNWDSASLIDYVNNLFRSTTFYLTATASDATGYYEMRSTGSGASVAILPTSSIPDQGYPYSWLSPLPGLGITVLQEGVYHSDFVARVTNASGITTLTPEVYLTDVGGVPYYELPSGQTSDPMTNTFTRYQLSLILDSPITKSATDRVTFRLRCTTTAATKDFELKVEGDVLSHVDTPISSVTTNVESASHADHATMADTASYAYTASVAWQAMASNIAISASWASASISASYAESASFVPNLYPQIYQESASWASSSLDSLQSISSSWASSSISSSYILANNVDGKVSNATSADTASYLSSSTVIGLPSSFGITIGDGVNAVSTGVKGYIQAPYSCTISNWSVAADQISSCEIDIWKTASAGFPPTSSTSICGGQYISMSAIQYYVSSSIPSVWTSNINSGDWIGFYVSSSISATRLNVKVGIIRS
jgi:hypothetical protein